MHALHRQSGCLHASPDDKAVAAKLQVGTANVQAFTLMQAILQGCRPRLRPQPERGFGCLPPQSPSCAWPQAVAAAEVQPLLPQPLQVSAGQAGERGWGRQLCWCSCPKHSSGWAPGRSAGAAADWLLAASMVQGMGWEAAAGQALGGVHHQSNWMGCQQHKRLTRSQSCMCDPHLVQSDLAGLTLLPLPSCRPAELVLLWRVLLLSSVPSDAAAW